MLLSRPTFLEIDLGAAAANMAAVRKIVGGTRRIYAVVKADGYGHGAVELGKAFLANGADALAVADLGEGVRLRAAGIHAPVLVYPNTLPDAARTMVEHDLCPVVADMQLARAMSDAAPRPVQIFASLDLAGEGLGFPANEAADAIAALARLPHIALAGLSAHPPGRMDSEIAKGHLNVFMGVVQRLEAQGIAVPVRLLAASPSILEHPSTYLNAVDPGRMLYGITYPGENSPIALRTAFVSLATRLIWCSASKPGDGHASTRTGIVPIGAADGLNCIHAGRMLVRGQSVPILGKPSLEHTRLDLSNVAEAIVGDEVTVIGSQAAEQITLQEVGERHGISLNQIVTLIGPRVRRIYRNTRSDG